MLYDSFNSFKKQLGSAQVMLKLGKNRDPALERNTAPALVKIGQRN